MIRYTLRCDQDHGFDSWFQSAAAFEALAAGDHLSCPICGSRAVTKGLMAPAVRPARSATAARTELSQPQSEVEAAMALMRRRVEETSDYVGMNFVTEARRMHEGDAPERPIYGEAKVAEAQALLDDGVPVAPLPFMPRRKTN